MPPAPSTMIMNSTRARWVIAHWERLKLFMARSPVCLVSLVRLDGADLGAGNERLYAQGDDLVAVREAGGDERGIFRKARNRDRPQRQHAGVVDHIDGRAGAAVENGGQRQLGS